MYSITASGLGLIWSVLFKVETALKLRLECCVLLLDDVISVVIRPILEDLTIFVNLIWIQVGTCVYIRV